MALTIRLLGWLPLTLPFYLIRFKIGPLPTTLLEIYLGVLFVVFLVERGAQGVWDGWKGLERFRSPLLAWLVTILIAVFVSPSLVTGLGLWRAYVLEPALVFFILKSIQYPVSSIQNEDKKSSIALDTRYSILDTICRNLFLVTIALTVLAFVQFITGWGIPHPWNVAIAAGRRATGPFPYPNALALFVVPIGALALTRIFVVVDPRVDSYRFRAGTWIRHYNILPILALISAFISCVLARSDGGLIALAAATWLALIFQKPFRRYVIAGTAVIALLSALIPAIHQPIIRELTFQNWSGKVRMYMWRDTRAMLKDHWFFGAGFGGYPKVFKPYQRTTGIEVFQYPHNILLNLWSETGLLGTFTFIWIIAIAIVSSIQYPASSDEVRVHTRYLYLLPLLTILIHGLIDVPYFKNDLAIVFWLLVWITTQNQLAHLHKKPCL